jgi:Polyketide cyclase / dehydrase and lipid transport
VSEVHLRRLDNDTMLHRRAVAVVSIDATAEEVWAVLTDYERLPEFVPNLAHSERLETPPGVPKRVARLRQVRPALAQVRLGPCSPVADGCRRFGLDAWGSRGLAVRAVLQCPRGGGSTRLQVLHLKGQDS